MPPRIKTVPDAILAYQQHGVSLDVKPNASQATGDCPFCGREGKFMANVENGLWDCKRCQEKGNLTDFLRILQSRSLEETTEADYEELRKDRGLLNKDTLRDWGVCKSIISGEWLIPGYNIEWKITQLYRYSLERPGGRYMLFPTKTLGHGILGPLLFDTHKGDVLICEGPWDAMCLWEVVKGAKTRDTGRLIPTATESLSMAAYTTILGFPTCSTYNEKWSSILAGRNVALLYDNDHPLKDKRTGKVSEPAAWIGMRRVAQALSVADEQPKQVGYISWGITGSNHNPDLKHGYDVRDWLARPGATTLGMRVRYLQGLLEKIQPIPSNWIVEGGKKGSTEIPCKPCSKWADLIPHWHKTMKWTDGLDVALSVCMATVASTMSVGDQLWIMMISPPSTGKTVLCEALAVARKHVFPKDTLTGLFSGYQTDKEGTEDLSLAAKIKDKTLVIKDGDTLLKAPNREQILSQFRAMFDRNVRTSFGNKMGRNYESLNSTVIIAGTSALAELDTSELGERCLKVRIMDAIDSDLERDILSTVFQQTMRNMGIKSNGQASSQYDPDRLCAMQHTGGYVNWIRENAEKIMEGGKIKCSDDAANQCIAYASFIAHMRARPSQKQYETAEREFGPRLVSQIARLAFCLAVVLNRDSIDEEVMRRVKKVALDSSRGRVLEITKYLYAAGHEGHYPRMIAAHINESPDKTNGLLRFMRKIKMVDFVAQDRGYPRWVINDSMSALYAEVTGDVQPIDIDEDGDYT